MYRRVYLNVESRLVLQLLFYKLFFVCFFHKKKPQYSTTYFMEIKLSWSNYGLREEVNFLSSSLDFFLTVRLEVSFITH